MSVTNWNNESPANLQAYKVCALRLDINCSAEDFVKALNKFEYLVRKECEEKENKERGK